MDRKQILDWLREENETRLEELWALADQTRRAEVGDQVHLRGLIEFSNYCARLCGYCGLRAGNQKVERYRMTKEEILECAHEAKEFGYGTVVLQSGEDWGIKREWMTEVVLAIKDQTGLAVTLSLGERDEEDFIAWRQAGADRYLLRFETSNHRLYEKIHPNLPGKVSDRFAILRKLRELDYEVGSGVMIGIPGETYDDLANDLEMFRTLDLDMIGVGPYIPHPDTPLGTEEKTTDQVPNSELMTYKVVALTRLVCPKANIPSTTALATLNLAKGRELGLARGANIVMPNLTPVTYRAKYEIYPAKACIRETAKECHGCMKRRIESIGRTVGTGPGMSKNKLQRS